MTIFLLFAGIQGRALYGAENRGIPFGIKLMPQYLKELGYSTQLIGKWHVGFSHLGYTPLMRGFDNHVGYWTGMISYYDHIYQDDVSKVMFFLVRIITLLILFFTATGYCKETKRNFE